MDRGIHFERMRETSQAVIPLIKSAYRRISVQDVALSVAMERFVALRTGQSQLLLRPYLVRLGFEAAGGSDWPSTLAVCAAAEVINISTYQANMAFDSKLCVNTAAQRSQQYVCAMISLGMATEMIQSSGFPIECRNTIVQALLDANRLGYIGQFLDMHQLNISAISCPPTYSTLWELYVDRCEKLGGHLTSWCLRSGAILSGCMDERIEYLGLIGKVFGTAGQMLNDLGDLVPMGTNAVSGMRYQDAYSDVRQGKLTGPILQALENGTAEVRSMIATLCGKNEATKAELLHLTELLQDTGAFDHVRRKILLLYKKALRLADHLPRSQARSTLKLALTSLTTNKYFAVLRSRGYSKMASSRPT